MRGGGNEQGTVLFFFFFLYKSMTENTLQVPSCLCPCEGEAQLGDGGLRDLMLTCHSVLATCF